MARSTGSFVDQGCGTTDESVVTGGCDDYEGLTTLDTRGLETLIALMLVYCEGLARNCGLIDL